MELNELTKIETGTLLKITNKDKSVCVGFFVRDGKMADNPIIWIARNKGPENGFFWDINYTYLETIESVSNLDYQPLDHNPYLTYLQNVKKNLFKLPY